MSKAKDSHCRVSNAAICSYLAIPFGYMLIAALRPSYGFSFTMDELVAFAMNGFYVAAPFLLWAVLARKTNWSRIVIHCGFAGCIIAFALAANPWQARDPSGLPYQWVAYWPVAAFLGLLLPAFGALIEQGIEHRKAAQSIDSKSEPE